MHDDSLRAIAIEKRKVASRQRGGSKSQRNWAVVKHDDNAIKPGPLEENSGYTGIIQDWDLATDDSTSNVLPSASSHGRHGDNSTEEKVSSNLIVSRYKG